VTTNCRRIYRSSL